MRLNSRSPFRLFCSVRFSPLASQCPTYPRRIIYCFYQPALVQFSFHLGDSFGKMKKCVMDFSKEKNIQKLEFKFFPSLLEIKAIARCCSGLCTQDHRRAAAADSQSIRLQRVLVTKKTRRRKISKRENLLRDHE